LSNAVLAPPNNEDSRSDADNSDEDDRDGNGISCLCLESNALLVVGNNNDADKDAVSVEADEPLASTTAGDICCVVVVADRAAGATGDADSVGAGTLGPAAGIDTVDGTTLLEGLEEEEEEKEIPLGVLVFRAEDTDTGKVVATGLDGARVGVTG
jgi:hypothetical protein